MISFREVPSDSFGTKKTYICTFCSEETVFFTNSPSWCYNCDKELPDMCMLIEDSHYKQIYHFAEGGS